MKYIFSFVLLILLTIIFLFFYIKNKKNRKHILSNEDPYKKSVRKYKWLINLNATNKNVECCLT